MYANNYAERLCIYVPMDLEVARTPSIRGPYQFMTLPPAASILCNSSGLSGFEKRIILSIDRFKNMYPMIILTFYHEDRR